MNKKLLFGGVVIGLFLVLFIGGASYTGLFSLFGDKSVPAYLTFSGTNVLVNSGDGWENAKDKMQLSQNYKIKTGDNIADVVLYESIIISLEKNTEVSVKELSKENPQMQLSQGSTWNKFTGISGIKNYEISTPTTVASVRGTSFAVNHKKGISTIFVGEGLVDVEELINDPRGAKDNSNNGLVKRRGTKISLSAGEKAINTVKNKLEKADLTEEEKLLIKKRMKATLTKLKSVRAKEIQKHSKALNFIKTTYDLSDADITLALDDIDAGRLNDEELIKKSPIQISAAEKIKLMNNEIKKQQKLIKNSK